MSDKRLLFNLVRREEALISVRKFRDSVDSMLDLLKKVENEYDESNYADIQGHWQTVEKHRDDVMNKTFFGFMK